MEEAPEQETEPGGPLGTEHVCQLNPLLFDVLTILISPGNHLRNILRTSPNIVKSLHCEAIPGVLVQVVDAQGHLLLQTRL